MRATLIDVARQAGVSTATVDRVLNARAGVSLRTQTRVRAAAESLGYLVPEPVLAAQPVSLAFLLPDGDNRFIELLADQLRRQASARADVTLRIERAPGLDPTAFAAAIDALAPIQGLGIVAIDHPEVRDALRRLTKRGTRVLTLASDLQGIPLAGYVGLDNRSAGRLAGYLTHRFLGRGTHEVALFAGSVAYRGHEEREMGFRHMVSETMGQLQVVSMEEVRDDEELSYRQARDALRRHPRLAAIYNIGGGNVGIARALEEAGRAQEVVFIGHDLTDRTRAYLLSGTMDAVIDQNPRVEARDALEQLVRVARGDKWNAHPLRIQIVLRENLPEEV